MDILCFSHLRWDFVYQRPQHLLTRFYPHFRVFYFEEAFYGPAANHIEVLDREGVHVVRMHLSEETPVKSRESLQRKLLSKFLLKNDIEEYLLWFYTPMALPLTKDLSPVATIFDCMDELSAFRFAPPELTRLEKELLGKADIVFTGGHSLYEAKKHQHANIHSFPSSIDKDHFRKARKIKRQPADQQQIPGPKIGFYGVLDERFDTELVRQVADRRPEWQIVMLGPVVKIDPATLPRNPNIHYLGPKSYDQLPAYLSGWDIAMICFAINESTKFISPTKTPEYLSGGKQVISTPIRDVVETYGKSGLVKIAHDATEFVAMADEMLRTGKQRSWMTRVDKFLKNESWDHTVHRMRELIYAAIARKEKKKDLLTIYNADYISGANSLPAAS